MSQELQKMKSELIDHIDKALVSKAEQIPESWSGVIYDLTKKIDSYIDTSEQRWKRIEPYIEEAEHARKFKKDVDETAQKVTKWGGRWLIVASVVGSIYWGLKHIK